MPAPLGEQQALEQEQAELPAQIATYQRELDATPSENKAPKAVRVADPAGSEALVEIAASLAASVRHF